MAAYSLFRLSEPKPHRYSYQPSVRRRISYLACVSRHQPCRCRIVSTLPGTPHTNLMYPLFNTKYVLSLNHEIFAQVLSFSIFDFTHCLSLHNPFIYLKCNGLLMVDNYLILIITGCYVVLKIRWWFLGG